MAHIPREEKRDVPLSLRISTGEKKEWQAQADRHGVKISRFVRHVVNQFCKRQKKSKK